MSVSSIGGQSAVAIQQLVNMRSQFDDLDRQLSTGLKSDTYAGLGSDAGVTVGLNAQLSALSSFDDTINTVTTRIDLMSTALQNMSTVGSNVTAALQQANAGIDGSGQDVAQQTAQSSLGELIDLLNTQSGNRYLFSGSATDQPAVASYDAILNGDGSKAGLTQLISERNQADLGADGLGRLVISQPTSTSVSVAEDSSSPFGLKLASVTSNLTNGTVSGPSGSPASLSVDMSGGNPTAGDTITLRFNLPDGSSENLTLTATAVSPPEANQFTIGATPSATAANLQTALTASIGTLAATSLTAASAVAASNDFFDGDANNPPQRVSGPPFDTATSMVAGTPDNTVIWYTGEAGSGPASATATARVDPSLVISYGARANESGIRALVQNVATLAAVQISSSDPNAAKLSTALNQRLNANLSNNGGSQSIIGIETQLAAAKNSATAAQSRHRQTSATLNDFLQQITGVSNESVSAQLLALQTRMQASMQTTAMMFQTSLVNYLPVPTG
jgi:flagellar hook-associated protein 3 FlgL